MDTESVNEEQFWKAIWILLRNFHAVNKKLFACLIEEVFQIEGDIKILSLLIEERNLPVTEGGTFQKCTEAALESTLCNSLKNCTGFVVHQKLLTKKQERNLTAISLIDFNAKSYTCKFIDSNLDDFVVRLCEGALNFQALTQRNLLESSDRWLQYVLKPKLLNWTKCVPLKPTTKSLQLVDLESYNDLYKELKIKYAEKLKEIWLEANESTDPLKFIYEDLAIAAYLICLWRSKNAKPPTFFADLGCGNGLLVHVLNEEGFSGYGYDIRRRKLWSLYPAKVQSRLIEEAIVPFKFSMPDEVDWLIGNHSDELSPWIPVLTALERYETSYFLLPCCAFEFSGVKFQRRNAKNSTYQDFYTYARTLSQLCGFKTLEDRLKIPSTKRLALIGCTRTYDNSLYDLKCEEIRSYVDEEMKRFPHRSEDIEQIKLRDKHESVRNCTKIDKDIITNLVSKIFNLLLEPSAQIEEKNYHWRPGRRLPMSEIASYLTQQDLQNIKSECGGIKTLLRNKHEVFEFLGGDMIGLRKPQKRCNQPLKVKRRACYFNENHPDGCPLSDLDCNFLHEKPS